MQARLAHSKSRPGCTASLLRHILGHGCNGFATAAPQAATLLAPLQAASGTRGLRTHDDERVEVRHLRQRLRDARHHRRLRRDEGGGALSAALAAQPRAHMRPRERQPLRGQPLRQPPVLCARARVVQQLLPRAHAPVKRAASRAEHSQSNEHRGCRSASMSVLSGRAGSARRQRPPPYHARDLARGRSKPGAGRHGGLSLPWLEHRRPTGTPAGPQGPQLPCRGASVARLGGRGVQAREARGRSRGGPVTAWRARFGAELLGAQLRRRAWLCTKRSSLEGRWKHCLGAHSAACLSLSVAVAAR